MEPRYGHRQIEAARAGASRIHVQHSAFFGLARLVRMPAHDHLKSGRNRIEIEGMNVMQDVNRCAVNFNCLGFRQGSGPRLGIHISSHRKYRRDVFQRCKNFGITDIACVNDQLRTFQRAERLRAQQSVGV